MTQSATEPAPTAPVEPSPTTPNPAGSAVPEPATPPADPAPTEPGKPSGLPDDPAALRAEIERLRKENGAARTNAKAAAAEEAKQDFAQQIGRILGLVPDDNTPVDATALTTQLTEAQQASQQAALELAIYKAADTAGANPAALLDSRSFLSTVTSVDATDAAAITDAITQAVAANPAFGKAPSAPTPALRPNPGQGTSAQPPLGIAEQIQAAQAAGNTREVMRLKSRMATAGSDQ